MRNLLTLFSTIFICILLLIISTKIEKTDIININFNFFSVLFDSKKFEFKEINFINLNYLSEKTLYDKIDFNNNKNFFKLNLEDLKKKILTINEIKSVKIEKKISGILDIYIQEEKPSFIWEIEGAKSMINMEGKILNFSKKVNLDLLLIKGEKANLEIKNFWMKIEPYNSIVESLKSIEYINKYRWNINLFNNILIKFPENKIEDSIKIIAEIIEKNTYPNYKVFDMRVSERIFVK